MAIIPTKQIDGDVAVGRNVTAGGDANVQGDLRVGHNMKVEGWLDAPNIKGDRKGWFADYESLLEEYPEPTPGSWALVGTSLPATLYLATKDGWVNTNTPAGEDITIESDVYDKALEKLNTEVGSIKDNDAEQDERINGLINSKGQPDGIAPLNRNGQISPSYLPLSITLEDTLGLTKEAGKTWATKLAYPRRLYVTYMSGTVGVLDMFGDSGAHALTQIFTTRCFLEDGTFNGSHTDEDEPVTYSRTLDLKDEGGGWSPWRRLDNPLRRVAYTRKDGKLILNIISEDDSSLSAEVPTADTEHAGAMSAEHAKQIAHNTIREFETEEDYEAWKAGPDYDPEQTYAIMEEE